VSPASGGSKAAAAHCNPPSAPTGHAAPSASHAAAANGAPGCPPVTVSEHEGVRYPHLDTDWIQGAMRVGASYAIELEYVVAPAKFI